MENDPIASSDSAGDNQQVILWSTWISDGIAVSILSFHMMHYLWISTLKTQQNGLSILYIIANFEWLFWTVNFPVNIQLKNAAKYLGYFQRWKFSFTLAEVCFIYKVFIRSRIEYNSQVLENHKSPRCYEMSWVVHVSRKSNQEWELGDLYTKSFFHPQMGLAVFIIKTLII